MTLRWSLRPNAYYDSIKLMRVSESLSRLPGVTSAAAVMATPLNLELLAGERLLPEGVQARPDDLLIAVAAESDEAAQAAMDEVESLLTARAEGEGENVKSSYRTLDQAAQASGGNLAVIAVPGSHAATEAYAALHAGLHVFLFSDNVPLRDEVRLKVLAEERGLLMMGPDCGTAILNGVGLGFANRMNHGPIGIVGASGTGIQQLCGLLDRANLGIAQAIGTGGRDLSAEVGGSMTRRALRLLAEDDTVQSIALISKPADSTTTGDLHADLLALGKPVVACLLGETPDDEGQVRYASNLTEAARLLVDLCGGRWVEESEPAAPRRRNRGSVFGLFAGGTLRSEAARVLDAMSVPHHLLDLGDDQYTRGRAHPMIDSRLRASMLAELANRSQVGAVLLDVVLGDLASPDPAGDLAPALQRLRAQPGGGPPVIAALIGTRRDPQGLEQQRKMLEGLGVRVFASNAHAARSAGILIEGAA